jgi:hypothetical protein
MSSSRVMGRRRPLLGVALVLVLALGGWWAVAAFAGAGTPTGAVTVSTSGLTATLSGTWSWSEQKSPCGPGTAADRAAGWAVQWGDRTTGNSVLKKGSKPQTFFHVGTATDNTVYHSSANSGLGDCGNAPAGKPAAGTWGPISHTYATPGTYTACTIIYDVHYNKQGLTTLSAAITSTQGNLPVASSAKISNGEVLVIDSEQMLVTGIIGNSVFVTRHVNGTSAAAHKKGAPVNGLVSDPKESVAGSNATPYSAGDHNSDNSAEQNAQCLAKSFTVKQPTTLVSTPGATVTYGDGNKLTDSAILSGGFNPTGTMTFYLFAPGITPAANYSNNVYSDTVTVSGNGNYSVATGNNPGGYLPSTAGTYQWVAVYSGDSLNAGSQDGSASEQEIVKPGVTVGNFVWEDLNGNGVQDSGEPGIAGVTLTLTGTKSGGGSVTDHATTDANGHYLFSETPGTYTVAVDTSNFAGGALAGYAATATGQGTAATDSNPSPSGTTPAALPSGGSDLTVDFGYYRAVTIGDFVWNDSNGNGIQDGGEPGINGVTLTLTGTTGAGQPIVLHTATSGNGRYFFVTAPGTYTVSVDSSNFAAAGVLADYTATPTLQGANRTVDSNPSPSGTTPAALPSFASDTSIDFGYSLPVKIGDFVWNDLNGNGIQDGEPGLNGVTVTLTGTTGAGQAVTDSTTTSGNGSFLFTEAPGTYSITVHAPSGFVLTSALQGSDRSIDSNASPSGTTPATLAGGGSDQTIDFGLYQPVTISDFVWKDANLNGLQDGGEPGIDGVTLTLSGTDGLGHSVTDHATTAGGGHYSFTEAPGTYTVTVDSSNFTVGGTLFGYAASPTLVGPDRTIDSNANPSGTTPAALASGGSDSTVDFGYIAPNQPPVNHLPAPQTLNEDGTLTFSAANSNGITISDPDAGAGSLLVEVGVLHGTLTVTGVGTSDGLAVFGTISEINALLDGMTYKPDPNYNGTDTLSITTNDNGNTGAGGAKTDSDTLDITVNPVNDAPSFDLPGSPNQSVVQDSGAQTVSGFATNISAGPANESSQTVTFHTSNDNNGLFSAQPSIDESTGDLTYTPAAGQTGTATVSVYLTDNGGTANGGNDTSATKTFTITVHPPNSAPTDIQLTPSSIPENSGPNATVGTLTSVDPDAGDSHTYSFVTGTGDDDNGAFTIGGVNGDQLIATNSFDFETKSSYTVRIQSDDGHGNTFAKALTVTVTNVNEPPTDITLTNNSIAENSGANAVIGTLGATDPDTGESYSFSLQNSGCGVPPYLDNNAFNISGSSLRENASFDFETKSSYTICVRVTDGPNTFDKSIVISVTNVNEPPTDITLSNNSIAENSGANTVIGLFGTVDPDSGETYSFSLPNSGCSAPPYLDNGAFSIAGAKLQENASFDFETKSSYTICVRVTDGPNTFDKPFTINVTNVNEAPTDISLDNNSIDENKASGSLVGDLSQVGDPDSGETYTFTLLTSGCAGTFNDSSSFQVSGSHLQSAVSFNYEDPNHAPSYTICVRVNDPGSPNLHFDKTFTIDINDVNDNPVDGNEVTSAVGNTLLEYGSVGSPSSAAKKVVSGNLLSNATDEDQPPQTLSISASDSTSANGGSVSVSSDGAFSYVPPAGFTGTDTFNYTVSDGNGGTDTSTVTIMVNNRVWYVKNNATAGGLGRSTDPFDTLAEADTAANASGDIIYVYKGDGTTTGLTGGFSLLASQKLLGEPVNLVVGADTLATGTPANRPSLSGTVSLASGSRVEAVDIAGSAGAAIAGTNTGGSDVTNVNLSGANGGVALTGAAAGTFNFTNFTINTTGGTGFLVNSSGAPTINVGSGSTENVSATGGPAVDVRNANGSSNLSFDAVSSTNSSGAGINLDSNGATPFSASSGSISGAAGNAIDINGGSGNIAYPGTLGNGAGNTADITGRTGGSITLSGDINDTSDAGGGITMSGNTGGSTTFSGTTKTLNTGASAAFSSTGSGHTITFSGGGLNIDTTSGAGFSASGGGTVNVTGSNNTIDTTTGTALTVSSTTIGASNLNFLSIAANGAANGIVLNATGATGHLAVSGSGSTSQGGDNSGGTIQNTTGAGISLTNTSAPSFNNMNLQSTTSHGVSGTQVTDFSFTNGTINNAGTASGDSCAFFGTANGANASGTFTFTNNKCTQVEANGVDLETWATTLSDVNISNNQFTDTGDTLTPGSAVVLTTNSTSSSNSVVTKAELNNNSITDFRAGAGFVLDANSDIGGSHTVTYGTAGSATNVISVTGNLMNGGLGGIGNQPDRFVTGAINGRGTGNYNVSSNGTVGSPITHIDGVGIELSDFGPATMSATANSNRLVVNNAVGSAGIGIGCDADSDATTTDNGTLNLTIDGNNVSLTDGPGIFAIARNSSCTLNTKITNNTVAAPATTSSARAGIRVDSGSSAGDTTLCLLLSGNVTAGSTNTGTATTSPGINLRKQGTVVGTNDFGIVGLSPSPTGTPTVENYVNGLNTSTSGTFGVGGTALLSATSGFTSCSLPF